MLINDPHQPDRVVISDVLDLLYNLDHHVYFCLIAEIFLVLGSFPMPNIKDLAIFKKMVTPQLLWFTNIARAMSTEYIFIFWGRLESPMLMLIHLK